MGISGPVDYFEHDLLTANRTLAASFEGAARLGSERIRETSRALSYRPWPGVTSASSAHRAALEAELNAILISYARTARPTLSDAEVDHWHRLVREAQLNRGAGMLVDELSLSTVGASLLRDRLCGPTPAPSRGVRIQCDCGYAVTGSLPATTCTHCGDVVMRRWVAEERRLLAFRPRYAASVTAIIERTARHQMMALAVPAEFMESDAAGKRRSGGRKLARLSRLHCRTTTPGSLDRWHALSEIAQHDSRPSVATEAAWASQRGLGAAGLCELALRAEADVVRREELPRVAAS